MMLSVLLEELYNYPSTVAISDVTSVDMFSPALDRYTIPRQIVTLVPWSSFISFSSCDWSGFS